MAGVRIAPEPFGAPDGAALRAEMEAEMLVRYGGGLGAGRALLAALEAEARRLGATCVRLETGPAQPEAIGLYERAGYRSIPCWGAYAELEGTLCFERALTPS